MPSGKPSTKAHVCGAIVVHHPDPALLSKAMAAAAAQVQSLMVIANDDAAWSCPLPENATLANSGSNVGLAAAYNRAARWASAQGATHLLLLDQDSVPAPGMVAALLEAFAKPGAIAAAGPLWRDSRTGEDGFFVRLTRLGARKRVPARNEILPVDFLISSGSLIALQAHAGIGPFDEALFIEHVDTDWALRARAKGYALYGVADARMDHALGEAALTTTALGRKQRYFLYSPERNYFLLRNSIMLWRRPYAPWAWVLHDFRRTVSIMLFYAIFIPPRIARMKAMLRAMHDGLMTKASPIQ